jgi:flagellar FliL protein
MAANRTEAAPAAEDTAAPAQATAPAAAAAMGGFKAWWPLIITGLAMPALAYAMTAFVLLPKLQKGLGITAAAAEATPNGKSAENAHKESVTMSKLLVNVKDTLGARYLLVSLSVVGSETDFKDKMQEHEAQLKDMACGALATKTLADLEKPGARNLIRAELISGFNNILGSPAVKEIYLTEFAIQ